MAESFISFLVEKLSSIAWQQVGQAYNLVSGVETEVSKLTNTLEAIKAVVEDAEKREVKDSAVKHWLDQLKDVAYDIDELLDEWNTEILKREIEQEGKEARPFTDPLCRPFFRNIALQYDFAGKIKKLNERLALIDNQRSIYNFTSENRASPEKRNVTTSIIDESKMFGREEEEKRIKDMLLCDSSEETHSLRIISVVGLGGIGKTTLTQLAFNDLEVKSHFEERIWVCVSDPFEEERIAMEILESLIGKKPDLEGRDKIMREIRARASGKKILLVLDDVWTEDRTDFEQLKNSLQKSSPGSRILITTRNKKVGKVMGSRKIDMFSLGTLPKDKCWLLFYHLAFFDRPKEECESLESIGREIVKKCRGMPLAVKTVGGLLLYKVKEQWQSILDSEMWEIKEVQKGLFAPLLLSYYELQPALRQCFSYCAIFPKDYVIKKDRLIKLWMAQGFLKEIGNKGMEIIGEEYFNELAMRSLFQDFEKDINNVIFACKMHDIVHDFAQYLTEKECMLIEIDGVKEPWKNASFKIIRHSMNKVENEATFPFPDYRDNWKKMRSLLVECYAPGNEDNLLKPVLDQFTCLRALDFYAGGIIATSEITMVPSEIGKFIHLRYLNLSDSFYLRELPEAICGLYNLQILDITASGINVLPRGIGKLINLMYLENKGTGNVKFMPKGMEKLMRLRTLKEFTIGNLELESCCSLKCLGKLNHLQGYLDIKALQNVDDASDAREARLSTKTGLRHLILGFGFAEGKRREENEASVLEALQPPPNLEILEIINHEGPLFPNWMVSLTMLKTVKLYECRKWESLPPLGKLPYLENLIISKMDEVKNVGEEFLGIEREDQALSSSSSSSITNHYITFPNLITLRFLNMKKWEEWEYGNLFTSQGAEGQQPSCVTFMPRLRSLSISECPKLNSLPHHLSQNTTIRDLRIEDCPILEERYKKGMTEDWHYISHIPTIRLGYENVQGEVLHELRLSWDEAQNIILKLSSPFQRKNSLFLLSC